MTTSEQPKAPEVPAAPKEPTAEEILEGHARKIHDEVSSRAKELSAAATALKAFAQRATYDDLPKLRTALSKLNGAPALHQVEGAAELLGKLASYEKEASDRHRQSLGRELKAACDAEQIPLRVVSREHPIEVRLSPFAVKIDFEKSRAEFLFARLPLSHCPAKPSAILAERARLERSLSASFDAATFFDRCQRAWRAARAALGEGGERVEILDFLPYLAVEMQSAKFRVEPLDKHFTGYSRAQFAWDVLHLRREKKLTQNGLRLNLGVATGSTASQKKRVIYFEDEDGNGEYKLTIFFTRVEEPNA